MEESFQAKVKAFLKALTEAGATIEVSSTTRSEKRAYLFHWSWKIALSKCKPSDATELAGVDIQWDHGDLEESKAGAWEMVNGFGLAIPPNSIHPPSLTSNHITGRAIDLIIEWSGTIKVKMKDGTEVPVTYSPDVNTNTVLHSIGESYGVKKIDNGCSSLVFQWEE